MKKLLLSVFAGLFVLALSSVAYSGMHGHSYSGHDSIDVSGLAVVTISSPSYSVVSSHTETIYLDSNGLWAVNDYSVAGSEEGMMARETFPSKGRLYCFDSNSVFCASAF